jgi:hypothetical protein
VPLLTSIALSIWLHPPQANTQGQTTRKEGIRILLPGAPPIERELTPGGSVASASSVP